MAGIRIYFGNHDKTLIRRQREDDQPARVGYAVCPSAKKQRPPTNYVGFGNGYSY
jgi:hypothetical protein